MKIFPTNIANVMHFDVTDFAAEEDDTLGEDISSRYVDILKLIFVVCQSS